MKVGDYEVDYNSGHIFSCCEDHIREHKNERTYDGHIISCEFCGAKMKLTSCNGTYMWVGVK